MGNERAGEKVFTNKRFKDGTDLMFVKTKKTVSSIRMEVLFLCEAVF